MNLSEQKKCKDIINILYGQINESVKKDNEKKDIDYIIAEKLELNQTDIK